MSITSRVALGAVATLAAGATVVSVPAAQAAAPDRPASTVTIRSSDYEVRSGQQFYVRGHVTGRNKPLENARVRIQSYSQNNGWQNIQGAAENTDSLGHYRLRLILQSQGFRKLRVVANPAGDRFRNSRAHTVVRVD